MIMNYEKILNELNNASLFELYRLNLAIWKQLDNPDRNFLVKKLLTPNKAITYFEPEQNRLIEATVIDVKRTRAIVRNLEDGRNWSVPFYQINIDNTDADIKPTTSLDRNSLKVGDHVCFTDKAGQELFGKVYKLNPKTAGIMVDDMQWRVAYPLLSPIMDGELGQQILEGQISLDK